MKCRFNIRRHLNTGVSRRTTRLKLKRNYNIILFGFNCVLLSVVLLAILIAVGNHRIIVQPQTKRTAPLSSIESTPQVGLDENADASDSSSANNEQASPGKQDRIIKTEPTENRLATQDKPPESNVVTDQQDDQAISTGVELEKKSEPAKLDTTTTVTMNQKLLPAITPEIVSTIDGVTNLAVLEPGSITLTREGGRQFAVVIPAKTATSSIADQEVYESPLELTMQKQKKMPDYQKLRENMLRVADALVKLNSTLTRQPKKELSDAADELIKASETIAAAKTTVK